MSPLDRLPRYDGLPVPWVAMWSGESHLGHLTHWRGITWLNNDRIGAGVPDFGSTNSKRQRMGMLKGFCQVCGQRDADLWVIPDDRLALLVPGRGQADDWDDYRWIRNPPVHRACLDAASSVCPHLVAHDPYAVLPVDSVTVEPAMLTTASFGHALTVVTFDYAARHHAVGREIILQATPN